MEPPAKQRKIVEPAAQSTAQSTGIHRPASAQSIARPGTAGGQLRPPSRVNGHSQSLINPRLAQSTTSRTGSTYASTSSTRPQLSQSVYGQPRGHVRAKSQMAAPRQANTQDITGALQSKLANGTHPPTISICAKFFGKEGVNLRGTRRSVPLKRAAIRTSSSRSCSAPVRSNLLCASPVIAADGHAPANSDMCRAMANLQPQDQRQSTLKGSKPIKAFKTTHSMISRSFHSSAECSSKIPYASPAKTPKASVNSGTLLKASGRKSPKGVGQLATLNYRFLSKDSNLTHPDWDNKGIEGRIALVEGLYESLKTQMEGTSFERSSMKELMEAMRVRSGIS